MDNMAHTYKVVLLNDYNPQNFANKLAKEHSGGFLFLTNISSFADSPETTRIRIDWYSQDTPINEIIQQAKILIKLKGTSKIKYFKFRKTKNIFETLKYKSTIVADNMSHELYLLGGRE